MYLNTPAQRIHLGPPDAPEHVRERFIIKEQHMLLAKKLKKF